MAEAPSHRSVDLGCRRCLCDSVATALGAANKIGLWLAPDPSALGECGELWLSADPMCLPLAALRLLGLDTSVAERSQAGSSRGIS